MTSHAQAAGLNLLTSADLNFRGKTQGHRVIRWIETHCVYTQGKWVGQPARLLPWEKEFILHLFRTRDDGSRKYRWALLGIPKKNGKTELAAWLALYFLIGDEEPSPWVCAAASTEHQANLVYGAAHRCADWSPTLRQVTERYNGFMNAPSVPGSQLQRLAAVAGANDGPSWHAVIIDELHEWQGTKGRNVWTVLTNGIGARDNPMILQITTAGFDLEGTVCGQQYTYGKRLATGEIDPNEEPHDEYLFWWYEGPTVIDGEPVDYRDIRVWKAANPSWNATLPNTERYLRGQLAKKTEGEFKRYFLNMWTHAEDSWLADGDWERNQSELQLDRDLPLYVGIDGALKRDRFAINMVQLQKVDHRDIWVTRSRVWENPYPVGHPRRNDWKLKLEEPFDLLRQLYKDYPVPAWENEDEVFPGPAFGYDPAYIEYGAQVLEGEGLNMIEVPQSDSRICPACELLYQKIIAREIAHDGDRAFQRHVYNAKVRQKARGWRVEKSAGNNHIDALSALIMSTYLLVAANPPGVNENDQEGPSIW